MARVLTARAVEAARPQATRQEIPDGALPGLYLVVQPSGARSWAVRYRHAGKPRKATLGAFPALTLADARDAARAALRAAAEGADPAGEKVAKRKAERETPADPDRDLVRGVVADFLARHVSQNRSAAETRRIFTKEVLPIWGARRLDTITRRDVIELLDGIADRGSPIMANRTLAAVRKLFNWSVSRDVLQTSPASGVKPPAAERSRERILTDGELRLFWTATAKMGPPFGPMFRVLLLTAQRRDEVGELREAEISGDLWTIPAARAKNGRPHQVPLSAPALAALELHPRVASAEGWIFTTNGETPPSGYSRAKTRLDALMLTEAKRLAEGQGADPEAVQIPHWTLHDLRRTAASGMARCGVNMPVIERVLNHVSGSFGGVAGVYNRHGYEAEVRRALEAWGAFVLTLVEAQSGNVVSLDATRSNGY